MLDILKLFYCQRAALFEILHELKAENWEPVYRILQNEPEIVQIADELFAVVYASIEVGKTRFGDSRTIVKRASSKVEAELKWLL